MTDVRALAAGVGPRTAPSVLVPLGSLGTTIGQAVWFGANNDLCMKFDVPSTGVYRYALLNIGTASGNIQISVVRFDGTGDTPRYERVMSTGIIACPTAGANQRIDLGATVLTPGRYGLSLWCDNIVAQFQHNNDAVKRTARMACHLVLGAAGGVPQRGAVNTLTSRYILPFALEGDI